MQIPQMWLDVLWVIAIIWVGIIGLIILNIRKENKEKDESMEMLYNERKE